MSEDWFEECKKRYGTEDRRADPEMLKAYGEKGFPGGCLYWAIVTAFISGWMLAGMFISH